MKTTDRSPRFRPRVGVGVGRIETRVKRLCAVCPEFASRDDRSRPASWSKGERRGRSPRAARDRGIASARAARGPCAAKRVGYSRGGGERCQSLSRAWRGSMPAKMVWIPDESSAKKRPSTFRDGQIQIIGFRLAHPFARRYSGRRVGIGAQRPNTVTIPYRSTSLNRRSRCSRNGLRLSAALSDSPRRCRAANAAGGRIPHRMSAARSTGSVP